MVNRGAGAGADYRTRPLEGAAGRPGPRASLTGSLNAVFISARQAVVDFFELAALELKRAGVTLVWMAAWGAFAALMVTTAWFGLMVALVMGLQALQVPDAAAVLIVVALNVVGAGAIGYWCVSASKRLALTATRRQLRSAAAEASGMTTP